MALTLQHGLSPVIRRRAPLDDSVAQATRDALEQGDWLRILSATGLWAPVPAFGAADYGAANRVAQPIIIEPQQPDAQAAGMAVAFGYHSGQTDRFAAVPLFTGFGGTDIPAAARVAPAYASGVGLIAVGFEAAAGGSGATPLVFGLTTVLTSGAENAFAVAYVERTPADNNGLLQYVVF